MKKSFFLILIAFIAFASKSQNYFETLIPADDGVFREGKFVVETQDHGFIISCDAQYIYQNDMLVKLSPDGQILKRLVFQIDNKKLKYCKLYRHPDNDNEYLAITTLISGDSSPNYLQKDIALIVFDAELNVLNQTVLDFGDEYVSLSTSNKDMPRFIPNDDGTVTMAAHCKKTDSYCYTFAKFTMEGLLLKKVETDTLSSPSDLLWDTFSKKNSDDGFGMIVFDRNPGESYYIVDSSFNLTRIGALSYLPLKIIMTSQGNIPDTTYYYYGIQGTTEYLNDSVSLVSDKGRFLKHLGGYYGNFHFVAMLSDSLEVENVSVWDAYRDGSNYITNTQSARDKAISVTDDAIFHCGVKGLRDHAHYTGGSIAPSTITVSKFDRNLNLIWRRYISKKDDFFDINVIQATEDGGCIISGIYSSVGNYFDFYAYIHKFDGNGYDDIGDNYANMAKPYYCYPNPAKDYLYIELSPDVKCQSVEIYDLEGRLVETFFETSPETTINISNLETGVYIMNIKMENGKEYSEKIVKE